MSYPGRIWKEKYKKFYLSEFLKGSVFDECVFIFLSVID